MPKFMAGLWSALTGNHKAVAVVVQPWEGGGTGTHIASLKQELAAIVAELSDSVRSVSIRFNLRSQHVELFDQEGTVLAEGIAYGDCKEPHEVRVLTTLPLSERAAFTRHFPGKVKIVFLEPPKK